MDVIKAGGVVSLSTALENSDCKLQIAVCMALSRLLQEPEGQASITKQSKAVMFKLNEMLLSPDINVCRIAAYTLSISSQNEVHAVNACNLGAIDSLIQLAKQSGKKSTKFAQDALEKLLNHRKLKLIRFVSKILASKSPVKHKLYHRWIL